MGSNSEIILYSFLVPPSILLMLVIFQNHLYRSQQESILFSTWHRCFWQRFSLPLCRLFTVHRNLAGISRNLWQWALRLTYGAYLSLLRSLNPSTWGAKKILQTPNKNLRRLRWAVPSVGETSLALAENIAWKGIWWPTQGKRPFPARIAPTGPTSRRTFQGTSGCGTSLPRPPLRFLVIQETVRQNSTPMALTKKITRSDLFIYWGKCVATISWQVILWTASVKSALGENWFFIFICVSFNFNCICFGLGCLSFHQPPSLCFSCLSSSLPPTLLDSCANAWLG